MSFSRWINKLLDIKQWNKKFHCFINETLTCVSLFHQTHKKKWAIKPREDTEDTSVHITKWKEWVRKGYTPSDSTIWHYQKRQNLGGGKRTSGCQGLWGWGGMNRQRRSLLLWSSSVWSYNDGDMALYVYPNPQNIQHQERALRGTMDFAW